MEWRITPGVSHKTCEAHGEIALYLGFSGTAHVVGGLGYFIVEACQQRPQDQATLESMAMDAFDIEEGVDLAAAINGTVRQLHELGILAPCPPTI